ncbi:hypothetical protein D9Q98_008447 [Chlorella vulgaris]|uniref:Uncharacterized protein n=1 Tax=Chlorella vulgaris TaxID=3077 RepID=A0A9D4TGQ7_CHLVU|nr:hypothetical protein D9Q98_008447 [Chlorella vulgaris]
MRRLTQESARRGCQRHTAVTCAAAAAEAPAPQQQQEQEQEMQPISTTYPTRMLSPDEVVEELYDSQHSVQRTTYHSFYSSELGGIVTDPALFVVQLDDHMLHRGHAVFDTAVITDGYLYQLDQHLQRFLTNAAKANIGLPRGMSVEQMRRTILETAAAGCKLNGHVRYWLSAGRGGFGLSGNECGGATFYCTAFTRDTPEEKLDEYLRGWRVKTTPVPLKPPFFARIQSTDQLPNALALMDAQAEDYDQAVFVDGDGFVCGGTDMNLACLLADGTLVVPPFEQAVDGILVQRMMQLLPAAIEEGIEGIARVEQRPISLAEAKAATEVFFVDSTLPVMPVVGWDVMLIADGTAGLAALQVRVMLQQDMQPRPGSDQHTEVPYGFMTGMLD